MVRTALNQESGTRIKAIEGLASSRACHASRHRLDYRWLGEKPGRAASCSAERQMLRDMAKVSISLRS